MIQRDDRPDVPVYANSSLCVAPHISFMFTIQRANHIERVFWKNEQPWGHEGIDWLRGHHTKDCDLVLAMSTARALVRPESFR